MLIVRFANVNHQLENLFWKFTSIYIAVAGGDISSGGCCSKYKHSIFKIVFYFSLMHGEFRNELKRGEF